MFYPMMKTPFNITLCIWWSMIANTVQVYNCTSTMHLADPQSRILISWCIGIWSLAVYINILILGQVDPSITNAPKFVFAADHKLAN